MLKPKPQWLQRITPAGTWVTLAPHIYHPTYVTKPELYPDIIAHEEVHIRQQTAMGLKVWLTRYMVDKTFRMHQECEATAAQIIEGTDSKDFVIKTFQAMLNTATYFFCDISSETIKETIEHYLSLYHTVAEDPIIKLRKKLDAWKTSTWYTPAWANPDFPDFPATDYYGSWDTHNVSSSKRSATPIFPSKYDYEDLYPVLQKDGTTGYYSDSELSNNQNRRDNEDGQDTSTEASDHSWYQDSIFMEKYLDRY